MLLADNDCVGTVTNLKPQRQAEICKSAQKKTPQQQQHTYNIHLYLVMESK
jgi:hypothetical protein